MISCSTISQNSFSKRLRRWLRICTIEHSEGKGKVAAELEGLSSARMELNHEHTKMHLALDAMAEQLRASYGR